MSNAKSAGLSADKLRERLVSKGAAGAGQSFQKMRGAGKPAATSMTIGSGPPPKGVPK